MRSAPRSMVAVATAILAAGALAACGGDDDNPGGRPFAEIIVNGCNPKNPLIPGNSAETCGGNVLDVTTSKLIHYATEDAAPEMDIAESIETTDNQNFTVKIKLDYLFSDGTPVTADSFVKAWNWTAYGPNGYQDGYFFEPIEGYADVQCTGDDPDDPCAGGQPAAEEMTGLQVIDATTFTIATTERVSNLAVRLGYSAFAPLPNVFFEDPENYGTAGTQPVSAGPYVVTEFTQNKQIVVEKNPEYSGEFPGEPDKITFRVYTDLNAAYADAVAGNIDVINRIPPDNLTNDAWLHDFQDRGTSREQGVFEMIGINPNVDKRLENADLRKAISMAIDRQTIIEEFFAGAAATSTGWVSPVVDGYEADQCGEACGYDPESAKQLWDAAGGIDGELTLSFPADGGGGQTVEAMCNSIRQTLDVECKPTPMVNFSTFLGALEAEEVDGLFVMGWQMDYPSIENFLVPLYAKGAASNFWGLDDPGFEDLAEDAAAAPDLETANSLYQQAELRLAEDMRVIPLWYPTGQVAWSERVKNVRIDAFGVPAYAEIKSR